MKTPEWIRTKELPVRVNIARGCWLYFASRAEGQQWLRRQRDHVAKEKSRRNTGKAAGVVVSLLLLLTSSAMAGTGVEISGYVARPEIASYFGQPNGTYRPVGEEWVLETVESGWRIGRAGETYYLTGLIEAGLIYESSTGMVGGPYIPTEMYGLWWAFETYGGGDWVSLPENKLEEVIQNAGLAFALVAVLVVAVVLFFVVVRLSNRVR